MTIYLLPWNADFIEASPDDSETSGRLIRPETSDKVGTAGKGNAEAGTWKAPRKSDRKDLIESETQDRREAPGGKPERVSTK
ncbi:hypothetical protein, partial [Streptomyces hawaiiensis]|uniref:hypothetical protein n=1 Tax=Streptomyces hawaiiensis TaxID=67305 RepID=UPI0036548554